MYYLLFGLILVVIILFITANIQVSFYKKIENFSISTIGTIRDKIKLPTRNKIISSVKHRINKIKEIEDVQIVDPIDIYQYLD